MTTFFMPSPLQPEQAAGRGQRGEHQRDHERDLGRALRPQRDGAADQQPGEAEQDDAHSAPLVLGTTPALRGSSAHACRSARATALNWASTMWCASGWAPCRPARRMLTCSVTRAEWAKDSQMWRVRLVG